MSCKHVFQSNLIFHIIVRLDGLGVELQWCDWSHLAIVFIFIVVLPRERIRRCAEANGHHLVDLTQKSHFKYCERFAIPTKKSLEFNLLWHSFGVSMMSVRWLLHR